ncbi:GAF domain-like protein [Athelia psychrophila]|uniref:GAF domain-like protein n=1 Tax=Athelia psychrophila TaxID=1759441 RepID=A0A166X4Z4_9AGAM|nr:GAF domain-like protein [Fibularhizoctonia sp. CBS 109695]
MTHADSSAVPAEIQTKTEFWLHVYMQIEVLVETERGWVTNLANASSVMYNALLAFPAYFGPNEKAVNWCGFYLDSTLFPQPRISRAQPLSNGHASSKLLLGPFCGKPACQFINTTPGKARGVCADAYTTRQTVLVQDVEAYPNHIACDGETKSEIVCPLLLHQDGEEDTVLGVLDLDCLALGGFDEEDQTGLERIAELVVNACDW